MMFYCVFFTFPCGILGQVWYLIVSIPDLCHLSYYDHPIIANQDHPKVVSLLCFFMLVVLVSFSLLVSPMYQDAIIK